MDQQNAQFGAHHRQMTGPAVGAVLEQRQSAQAFKMIIAWRALRLTMLGRGYPEMPGDVDIARTNGPRARRRRRLTQS